MFIVPKNERESGLSAALRGLSGVADIGSKAYKESQNKKRTQELAENPSFKNIILADLDPKERVALLDALVQGGPNALQRERSPTEESSTRQGYTEEPPFSKENSQVSEVAEASRGLKPIPLPSQEQVESWNRQYGQRGTKQRLDQIAKHNERVEKQQDKRSNIRFEKNLEAQEKKASTAASSREVIEIASNLKSLSEGGKLSGPGKHYLSRITGTPITLLGGTPSDEQFIKGTKSLVAPYLARNYGGKGVGRVLQTEAVAAQQALVSGENSPEARKTLIDSIINLAEEDIAAEKDFDKALELYEEDDPRVKRYVEEQSEKRLRARLEKISRREGRIAKVLPESGEILYFDPNDPDLIEFERIYGS